MAAVPWLAPGQAPNRLVPCSILPPFLDPSLVLGTPPSGRTLAGLGNSLFHRPGSKFPRAGKTPVPLTTPVLGCPWTETTFPPPSTLALLACRGPVMS